MTPLSQAHTEVKLLVETLQKQSAELLAARAGPMQWDDHRTNAIGEIWRTLDRIEPGLGLELVYAMYPSLPEAASEAVFHEISAETRQRMRSFGGALAGPLTTQPDEEPGWDYQRRGRRL